MNKLHSFLFLSLPLATFSCSASEQPVVNYTYKQICDITDAIRYNIADEQLSEVDYKQFMNNVKTLKDSLALTNRYLDNHLRLTMATNLNSVKQRIAFIHNISHHINKTPHKISSALQYVGDTQKKLRNLSSPIAIQEIEQYAEMISNIFFLTYPSSKIVSDNEFFQQIGNENVDLREKRQQLFDDLDQIQNEQQNISEENIAKLKDLQKFLEIDQHKEANPGAEELVKFNDAMDSGMDSGIDKIKNGIRYLRNVVGISALAFLIYYCNLHTKFAALISYKD
ncbi:MAG TPA: hypothetical protein VHX42_03290 [Candidatus Babeliales bacterium]|nr:hypothetical protein [Candidatus Babeliales bacterium]